MKSSYSTDDVTLLLKDITGQVTPLPTKEREQQIQQGVHYSEMLPLEYIPSKKYMEAYHFALQVFAKQTADATCQIAEKIYDNRTGEIVLVSLARAGIPVGILIKQYLEQTHKVPVFHYAISIIRGRGVDQNAMKTILKNHAASSIQFVDGWIGKGAIQRELTEAMADYPQVSSKLAVLSDPAHITDLCGTHEDILIPSSCLNSTVSGLLSRTFYRSDLIGAEDYHGAAYYKDLQEEDLSYAFINEIKKHFTTTYVPLDTTPSSCTGLEEAQEIAKHFAVDNINYIKPGIGESTRVLLRRIPYKLLVYPGYASDPVLTHLIQLAKEKSVPVEVYPFKNYKACGIIKNLADA